MAPLRTLLDAPEQLLAAHDRLRTDGFSLITIVNARTALDARAWLGQWAQARGRRVITAPETSADAALAAYTARELPPHRQAAAQPGRALLRLPGPVRKALPVADQLTRERPDVAVVLTCGIGDMVESLLDPQMPQMLVSRTLQGLVPVDEVQRRVMESISSARKVPLLRGPSEGILFYMLEARAETRGHFGANVRIRGRATRSYEVDIACLAARIVVEIDGPEHDRPRRRSMDAEKQKELEAEGFRVARFTNATVIHDPVAVWRDIASMMMREPNQAGA